MASANASQLPPDQVGAANDPGDETARRYRFQYTWAAIVCCMLLDDTEDVIEVFCEHHEDVLIKHHDGKFTGHQVKSREIDQPVWKANDEQVRKAFARFVQLEQNFPGHFRAFRFLTNHPMYVATNAQSVEYVLNEIAKAPTLSDLPSPVRRWLSRIAKDAEATETGAFQALKKAKASARLPKLQDAAMRLIQALANCWPGATTCSHEAIHRAAQALVDECGRASALEHEQVLPTYFLAVPDNSATLVACISGKRMTPERLNSILDQGLHQTATLSGDPATHTEPGQGSTELLLKKLDAGGFSIVSLNSAEDLRDKADYLGIAWTKKYGQSKGLERYGHVRSLVLSDAARAFEATKREDQRFGPSMRETLKHLIQARREHGEQLYDCTNEHLEGIAYSLTSQCQVQWSTDRPWEEE